MPLRELPVKSLGAMALVPFNFEVRTLLTKQDRFGNTYEMFKHVHGQPYAHIPRGLINTQLVEHDHRVVAPVVQLIAKIGPRNDDQKECAAKSLALLKSGVDHVVDAPTGFGKSWLGAVVACGLGQRTLIVVTKNDLMEEWKNTLLHLIGVNPSEIGHVQQDIQNYKGCRFVIGMIHSLVQREYDPEFYHHFGLVIFDEVHRLGAEHFVQVCELFPARYRLGLSATPDRQDGRDTLFRAHIGPIMVRGSWIPMNPKILVKKTRYKVPLVPQRNDLGQWRKMPMVVVPGRMMSLYKDMGTDVARNTEIAEFVFQAFQAGRRCLVLSDLIEGHLHHLFQYIVSTGISGENIGYYVGGMTAQERNVSKNKPVILGTYKMTSEGTNVPHWDTLVLATPRADIRQSVGRILRFVTGKKDPVVLDLVDDHPVLKNLYFSRLKQYYSLKSTIVEV